MRAGILSGLPHETVIDFIDHCQTRHYSAPAEFLKQGFPAPGIFLIARGRAEISHSDPDGNSILIEIASPGDVLGEIEALTDHPCTATCTSLGETTLLFCPKNQLLDRVGTVDFFRNIISSIHNRLLRDNRLLIINQFYTLHQRLCIHLCQLSSPAQPDIHISQEQLAAMLACSRQTVNRKLAALRDMGLISLGKATIRVENREALIRQGNAEDQSN